METEGVGEILLNALAGVPAQLWTAFQRDPVPWLIVASMLAIFWALGAIARRRGRRQA
jgi:hypothetical protein